MTGNDVARSTHKSVPVILEPTCIITINTRFYSLSYHCTKYNICVDIHFLDMSVI